MNGERREHSEGAMNRVPTQIILQQHLTTMRGASCELDPEGHCVTCSDEALEASVLRVDEESGLALVTVNDTTEEVDITLVDDICSGDVLLVHGGVAIAKL